MDDSKNHINELSRRLGLLNFAELTSATWIWHKEAHRNFEVKYLRKSVFGYDLSIFFKGYAVDEEFSVGIAENQTYIPFEFDHKQVEPIYSFRLGNFDQKEFLESLAAIDQRSKKLECSWCHRRYSVSRMNEDMVCVKCWDAQFN